MEAIRAPGKDLVTRQTSIPVMDLMTARVKVVAVSGPEKMPVKEKASVVFR